MIIRGGENIYPREIEDLLLTHPDVADVSVVGIPDAELGEQVAAFLRPVTGRGVDPDRLAAFCRERLAVYKVPRIWQTVEEFPQTASGSSPRPPPGRSRSSCCASATSPRAKDPTPDRRPE